MVDLLMHNTDVKVQSNIHDYSFRIAKDFGPELKNVCGNKKSFLIIDKKVMDLYRNKIESYVPAECVIFLLDALEKNKNLEMAQKIMVFFVEQGIKKNDQLIAIGGGITQDICCFIASILYRGVSWCFFPTTLLSQCDSCIGSKSSINLAEFKNQVGTFWPPNEIIIAPLFTETQEDLDILSGIGEMIKVHFLDPQRNFQPLFELYSSAKVHLRDRTELIISSLMIKKSIIEQDEFDQNIRNIMNYGHTFGHALETFSDYTIPHGIAVSYGIGMANELSAQVDMLDRETVIKMELLLQDNFMTMPPLSKNIQVFWDAMMKDKKNIDQNINFILTRGFGKMEKCKLPLDGKVKKCITGYVNQLTTAHCGNKATSYISEV